MKPLRPPANESKEAVALRVAASAWAVAAHYLLPEIQGEALNRRLLEAYARKAAANATTASQRTVSASQQPEGAR